jgi:hypothetical protein
MLPPPVEADDDALDEEDAAPPAPLDDVAPPAPPAPLDEVMPPAPLLLPADSPPVPLLLVPLEAPLPDPVFSSPEQPAAPRVASAKARILKVEAPRGGEEVLRMQCSASELRDAVNPYGLRAARTGNVL